MRHAFPWLLLPTFWAARNRARRREQGDGLRALLFVGIAAVVSAAIFAVFFWLAWQLLAYEELGDYLVRLGLGWLFLTFLSFVAFSAVVTSLGTFFLSEDLWLLLPAPVPQERLFHSRFARTVGQSSWMVAAFLLPVLLGIGLARCAPPGYYLTAVATVLPFVVVPCALGALVTLGLVSVFPARRARDVLMLMGLVFAIAIVMLLRFIRPERLLDVQSLPDLTAFFATLQSPVTSFLPSFWAGESLFAGLRGHADTLHLGALWSTALASTILARMAYGRWYFAAWTKAQEARKARFTRLALPRAARRASADGRRPPGAAGQGPEGLPARHLPVVAAPAAARPRARLRLQLPRARPRAHPVHDRRDQERLRLREPGHGRLRHVGDRRPLRLPRGLRRGPRLLDRAHGAGSPVRLPVVQVLDRLRADPAAGRGPHDRLRTGCSASHRCCALPPRWRSRS